MTSTFAQSKHDYNWVFGYDNGPNGTYKKSIVDFDNNRSIKHFDSDLIRMSFNNASISDTEGNLLFYTNGCQVYDSTHHLMMNGDSINFNEYYEEFCDGYADGKQNTIILPDPAYDDGYYIFHSPAERFVPFTDAQVINSMYSYVDMQLNGDNGAIADKNVIYLPNDTVATSYLTAVYKDNGLDWWLIKSDWNSNIKFIFSIDHSGVSLEHMIPIGDTITSRESGGGQGRFSPDGSLYISYNTSTHMSIYDFDRQTGLLSNFRQVVFDEPKTFGGGMEISPNSRFAYAFYPSKLFQVDLWEDNPQDGVMLIDSFDGFDDPFPIAATFHLAQLGPDCKIYCSGGSGVPYLHVINKPDLKGTDCDFVQRGIVLPSPNDRFCMPNNPHFRIDEDDICDPNITSVFGLPVVVDDDVFLHPNPASDLIYLPEHTHNCKVYDINGRLISDAKAANQKLDIANLQNGMYILHAYSSDLDVKTYKFVKQ